VPQTPPTLPFISQFSPVGTAAGCGGKEWERVLLAHTAAEECPSCPFRRARCESELVLRFQPAAGISPPVVEGPGGLGWEQCCGCPQVFFEPTVPLRRSCRGQSTTGVLTPLAS